MSAARPTRRRSHQHRPHHSDASHTTPRNALTRGERRRQRRQKKSAVRHGLPVAVALLHLGTPATVHAAPRARHRALPVSAPAVTARPSGHRLWECQGGPCPGRMVALPMGVMRAAVTVHPSHPDRFQIHEATPARLLVIGHYVAGAEGLMWRLATTR